MKLGDNPLTYLAEFRNAAYERPMSHKTILTARPTADWEPMRALATRLGVDPLKPDETCMLSLHIAGADGEPDTKYDIIALVSALLDRLDKAEQKTHKPLKSAW